MSLVSPLNSKGSHQIGQHIPGENLDKLINAKSKEDVITSGGLKAFEEYQNAKIGYGHQARKFIASVGAYGTMVAAPVAGVIYGTYWLLKDYIHADSPLSAGTTLAKDIGSIVYNNVPMISDSIPVLGAVSAYTTPRTAMALYVAIDGTFYKTLGIAPVTAVANWSVLMLSSALAFAAAKAGDMVGKSYDNLEAESTTTRHQAQKVIINQTKAAFDNVAQGLLTKAEAAKNSPKTMVEIMRTAQDLEAQLPQIKAFLKQLELPLAAVEDIMDQLVTTLDTVMFDTDFEFRSYYDEKNIDQNNKYNTELLCVLSNEELADKVISSEIQEHVDIAKANYLGVMHSVKKYAATGACAVTTTSITSGVIVGLGALPELTASSEGADSLCRRTMILKNCYPQAVFGAGSLFLGMIAGYKAGASIYNSYVNERAKADNMNAKHTFEAAEKLFDTYDGIADHLGEQYSRAKRGKERDQVIADAKNILAKLPMIKQQIAATGLLLDADAITGELKTVLATILKDEPKAPVNPVSQGFFGSLFG